MKFVNFNYQIDLQIKIIRNRNFLNLNSRKAARLNNVKFNAITVSHCQVFHFIILKLLD